VALGAAIIGAGFIGRVHARSARLAGADLVAVGASTPEEGEEAAKELGAARGLRSLDELVDAPDIDVVHICTPNALHAEQVRVALRAGKHVICEKPLATSAEDAAELAALARATGVVAAVPFVYRFYASVRQARALVADGSTGSVRLLHGSYLQDWLSEAADWTWRIDPELGGESRAFADIGSHWCDVIEFVSGHRITRLSALFHTALPERLAAPHRAAFSVPGAGDDLERRSVRTEDAGFVTFETDQGAVGSAVISQVSPGRKNRLWFELDGADLALAFDQERPEELWIGARTGGGTQLRDATQQASDAARFSLLPAGHPQGYYDAFEAFVRDTYGRIVGEPADGLPTFDDGARSASIVATALEAARTGTWLDVPSTPS
jgi:predicted dehydrogenase